MATTFGAEGFICNMQETKKGYLLTVTHPRYPEVRETKEIDASELDGGVKADDRSQTDQIFAPLLDKAKAQYDELEAQSASDQAEADKARREESRKDAAKARDAGPKGLKAKDGTVGTNAL